MLEKGWLFNVTHVTTVPNVYLKTHPELIDEDLVFVIPIHHPVFLVPIELAARYSPLLGKLICASVREAVDPLIPPVFKRLPLSIRPEDIRWVREFEPMKNSRYLLLASPIKKGDLFGREKLKPPEPIEHVEFAVVDSEWHKEIMKKMLYPRFRRGAMVRAIRLRVATLASRPTPCIHREISASTSARGVP